MEESHDRVERACLHRPGRLVLVHEVPDQAQRHRGDGHGHEDQRLHEALVANAIEQHREDQAEGESEHGVEDEPEDHVVTDGHPGSAVREIGELGGVVVEAHPVAGVVLEALQDGADGGQHQEGGHQEERGSDPDPGPDLWPSLIRQPAHQVLAAHDVGGEYCWHTENDREESREILQQDAEVHSPISSLDQADLYALCWTLSRLARIESRLPWLPMY